MRAWVAAIRLLGSRPRITDPTGAMGGSKTATGLLLPSGRITDPPGAARSGSRIRPEPVSYTHLTLPTN